MDQEDRLAVTPPEAYSRVRFPQKRNEECSFGAMTKSNNICNH